MMRRWWLVGAACALTLAAPAIAGSQALAAVAPAQGCARRGSNVLLVCNGSTKPCPAGSLGVLDRAERGRRRQPR